MPAGTVYEIIDGVRRAKACQLAGLLDIPAILISTGSNPQRVSLDDLRARFGTIDASSTRSSRERWDRAAAGAKIRPHPFPPILLTPIGVNRAKRLVKIADVVVF